MPQIAVPQPGKLDLVGVIEKIIVDSEYREDRGLFRGKLRAMLGFKINK
jgi:hypothetical protein